MARSDKLYKDSPKMERDGDGKMGVKKPSEATAEDTGVTEPVPTEQLKEMFARHHSERHDMDKRHLKEIKKHHAKMGGKDDGEEGEELPEPAKKIEKKED